MMREVNNIQFYTHHKESPEYNRDQVIRWIKQAVLNENCEIHNIVVVFCDDEYLKDINKQYLQHDYYTDIITFHYHENADPIDGEIYISLDTVADNARTLNIPLFDELHRVIIHGILHLLGYDDKYAIDQELMRGKEDYYLSLLKNQHEL